MLYTHIHIFFLFFFFFNDTATTEIYTLSLHDALPISDVTRLKDITPPFSHPMVDVAMFAANLWFAGDRKNWPLRSEEHTSELQSLRHLVCRLLLEKKKKKK